MTPTIQIQRYRGKINIQRPRSPHFQRQLELDFTKYLIPAKKIDPVERCKKEKLKINHDLALENPYQRIIANECRNWFDHSKMVAIFHLNPMSSDDMFKIQVPLQLSNMYIKRYGRSILRMAFENTGYEALMPLFQSQSLIVFSAETQVSKLLKLVRRTPQFILLGGIIEGRLLNKEDFTNYSKLPDLQTARAQFAQLLLSAGSNITSQLNQHQSILVQHLDNRINQLKDAEDKK